MKLTKKEKASLAERIKAEGTLKEVTNNDFFENNFYAYRNRLANIQIKNGKLHDVIIYGCWFRRVKMREYFLNGKEITEQEAKEIEARNNELLKSRDISDWAECKFIIVVDVD